MQAAGWSDPSYWTGEIFTGGLNPVYVLRGGGPGNALVDAHNWVVCLR